MIRYVIKRIVLIIPIVICVSFIVYALVDLAPGNIVDVMINSDMTQEEIDYLRSSFDLDKPMVYRYVKYMLNLVRGDLGVSMITKISVWETYMYRLPNTLKLSISSLLVGIVTGLPLGIFAANHSGRLSDNATTVFAVLGISVPGFWLALLLLQLFALRLGILPAGGMGNGIRSLILPAVTGGLGLMASTTRQTRSSVLDVLKADYLRTARAKGVPERVVIRKHALGNALIPIVTVVGNSLAYVIAGSVITEQVYAWPGVGRMAIEALGARDVTTVLGTVILTTFFYVFILIVVDLVYAFIDPRIKARYTTSKKRKRKLAA